MPWGAVKAEKYPLNLSGNSERDKWNNKIF